MLSEIENNPASFLSYLFEAMLFYYLKKTENINLISKDEGPDFKVNNLIEKDIHIEAIAPLPGNNPNWDYEISPGVLSFNKEGIIPKNHIREAWTSAFLAKSKKFKSYKSKKTISKDAICIIAISPIKFKEPGRDNFILNDNENQLPYCAEALYGITRIQNSSTNQVHTKISDGFRKHKTSNPKKPIPEVPPLINTGQFHPKQNKNIINTDISAVILQDLRSGIGKPKYWIIHNYNANNKLPVKCINSDYEVILKEKKEGGFSILNIMTGLEFLGSG